jgi:acyl-CoA hydrolase
MGLVILVAYVLCVYSSAVPCGRTCVKVSIRMFASERD